MQEPTRKMSKSVSSPQGKIGIFDDPKDIERKIKRAVTDTDNEVRFDRDNKPGLANLLEIYAALTGGTPSEIAERYERYGDLKSDIAELLINELTPVRQRYLDLLNAPREVMDMLEQGAARARPIAEMTYERAAGAMGLLR
jgi:tryptophanyl-tRNA synthetase